MGDAAPRAILFDFGGVIWDMRWDVCRALEAEHGLPRGSIFETLYRSEAWHAVERGRGDREAWLAAAHAELERRAGRRLPSLHERWRAAQGPIARNLALARALRTSFRLAIVSNADASLRARLHALAGPAGAGGPAAADLFDAIVCSAEVGCAKPEPEIYALACRRLDVAPAACVFVDDHAPNVSAAAALGMRGVLYRVDRGDDLGALLAAAGVDVPVDGPR